MAGGAIQQSTVIQQNAEEVGLRPELTASIARTAVTRMAGVTYPQRSIQCQCVPPDAGKQPQSAAGVLSSRGGMLGTQGWLADAEVLLLLADCLNQLSLSQV